MLYHAENNEIFSAQYRRMVEFWKWLKRNRSLLPLQSLVKGRKQKRHGLNRESSHENAVTMGLDESLCVSWNYDYGDDDGDDDVGDEKQKVVQQENEEESHGATDKNEENGGGDIDSETNEEDDNEGEDDDDDESEEDGAEDDHMLREIRMDMLRIASRLLREVSSIFSTSHMMMKDLRTLAHIDDASKQRSRSGQQQLENGVHGANGGSSSSFSSIHHVFHNGRDEWFWQYLAVFGYLRTLDQSDDRLLAKIIDKLEQMIGISMQEEVNNNSNDEQKLTEKIDSLRCHERNLLALFYCLRGAEKLGDVETDSYLSRTYTSIALKLRADCTIALNNMGLSYERVNDLNDWRRSVFYLKRAAEIDPNYADCHFNLSVRYETEGYHVHAFAHGITACTIDADELNVRQYNILRTRLWNRNKYHDLLTTDNSYWSFD